MSKVDEEKEEITNRLVSDFICLSDYTEDKDTRYRRFNEFRKRVINEPEDIQVSFLIKLADKISSMKN